MTRENKVKWSRQRNEAHKLAAINVLTNGEGTCRCCGQGDIDVLTIDHINDDGAKHRQEHPSSGRIYNWLVSQEYPPGFQVLCMNCNVKKEVLRRRARYLV